MGKRMQCTKVTESHLRPPVTHATFDIIEADPQPTFHTKITCERVKVRVVISMELSYWWCV